MWVQVWGQERRPGTIAWRKLDDDVSASEKADRLHRLEAIENRISLELNETYLGTIQPVLVEGVRGDQPYGRTRTGKLVHLDAPARPGQTVDVRIDHAGPYALRGAPVDALALV